MRIGFVAFDIHKRGGMERAAAEVLERVAKKHELVVIATNCEVEAENLKWVPVPASQRPNLLYSYNFRRKARLAEKTENCTLTVAVGNAAVDADVIVAQFCHAAFTKRYGSLRGGNGRMHKAYQAIAQSVFMKQERKAFTSPRLKKVIAVSEGVKRELIEHYNLPGSMIVVIPNAVDHNVFKPAQSEEAKRDLRQQLGLPPRAFTCSFVGGDWDRKGLADAINAVAGVPEAVLAVVGRGNVKRFGEIAAKANAGDRVFFFGSSPNPQDYYAASDVFVFPTRYEAFSLATLEAAASGLPVLAPRINGTEELVNDGVNGFFIEMNPASIVKKLIELKENPGRLRRMSKAVHETSQRYTWDRVAAEHIKVYEDVGGARV